MRQSGSLMVAEKHNLWEDLQGKRVQGQDTVPKITPLVPLNTRVALLILQMALEPILLLIKIHHQLQTVIRVERQ